MHAALFAVRLTADPVWPWPALVGCVLLVLALTIWTYVGVRSATARRVGILAALRVLALVLAFMAVLRPSLAFQKDLFPPSALLVLADASESMSIRDAGDGQSRWDVVRDILHRNEATLQQLQDEFNVKVYRHRFAEDLGEFDPNGAADGKRTDFGTALTSLLDHYQTERLLRGVLTFSDGANNGTRVPVRPLAARLRAMPCPVSTFSVGRETTTDKQSDLALIDIRADPAPVPIKGALTVKGFVNAPGLANTLVTVRLLIDDKEVASTKQKLTKETGNEVSLSTDAPDKPGELKVTLKVDPLRNEAIQTNNEISTYVPVTKEGINVLYVEGKYRAFEPKFLRYALRGDPRFRLFETVRLNVHPAPGEDADSYQFDRRFYDVILIGDVSPKRLEAGDPRVLDKIVDLVKKGTGLLMFGGYESFTNTKPADVPADDNIVWRDTPLARLLPVDWNGPDGQDERPVRMVPTKDGLDHFLLRLADTDKENVALWAKLPKLTGMNRLTEPKLGTATVLARADDPRSGPPMLIAQKFGDGRVLAFAGDTTNEWRKLGLPETRDGVVAHARFWRQLVLWLARQEEGEGTVWIRPDVRRLAAGSKLDFSVGARGKGGKPLTDARFDIQVIPPAQPGQTPPNQPVSSARREDGGEERGTFVWTETPGEYRIRVTGTGKDVDGTEVKGSAESRFLVYHDDTELARQPADYQFLRELAADGGGQFLSAEEFPAFLADLRVRLAQAEDHTSAQLRPDWNATKLTPFLVVYYLVFVAVLCLEWFLRRRWGLV